MMTVDHCGSPWITADYRGLPEITRDFRRSPPGISADHHRGFPRIIVDHRVSPEIARDRSDHSQRRASRAGRLWRGSLTLALCSTRRNRVTRVGSVTTTYIRGRAARQALTEDRRVAEWGPGGGGGRVCDRGSPYRLPAGVGRSRT
jgi:hypothetical protein